MSRLIDSDENREDFMETVYEILSDEPDNIKANLIIEAFDSMEVAYDLESVVRELEDLKRRTWKNCPWECTKEVACLKCMVAQCIEIVKRGGQAGEEE